MGCSGSADRPSVIERNVPKLKIPPPALAKLVKIITSTGLPVVKLNSDKKPVDKTLIFDRRLESFTFLPSNKPYEERQYAVKDILAVIEGNDATPALAAQKYDEQDMHGFAVIGEERTFHLACRDPVHEEQIVQLFAFLLRRSRLLLDENPHRVRLVNLWLRADADGNGRLTFDELFGALIELHVSADRQALRRQFVHADADGSGTLDFDEFCSFFDALTVRTELRPLFDKFAGIGGDAVAIEPNELQEFMRTAQGETVTEAVAARICSAVASQSCMSFNDFCTFLTSPKHNSCVSPNWLAPCEDMDRPLNEYAIGAITPNSITSLAAIEKILESGVRYLPIELQEVDHRPVSISCPDVPLDKIAEFIGRRAFRWSPYPVWVVLSGTTSVVGAGLGVFRRHIDPARIFKRGDVDAKNVKVYTPSALTGKLILLGRPSNQATNFDDHVCAGAFKLRVAPDLDTLRAIAERGEFRVDATSGHAGTVLLFSRNRALEAGPKLLAGVARAAVCVVEGLTTVDEIASSPAQVVHADLGHWSTTEALVAAKFSLNGRAGYRRRPKHHIDPSIGSEPTTPADDLQRFHVRVLLGTQIPHPRTDKNLRDIVDPLVELRILGDEVDMAANPPAVTNYVLDNGFSPFWNEAFEFRIRNVESAFLTIRVLDWNHVHNDLVCEAVVPLAALRNGYRAIEFTATDGSVLPFTSLLCHFNLQPRRSKRMSGSTSINGISTLNLLPTPERPVPPKGEDIQRSPKSDAGGGENEQPSNSNATVSSVKPDYDDSEVFPRLVPKEQAAPAATNGHHSNGEKLQRTPSYAAALAATQPADETNAVATQSTSDASPLMPSQKA